MYIESHVNGLESTVNGFEPAIGGLDESRKLLGELKQFLSQDNTANGVPPLWVVLQDFCQVAYVVDSSHS